MYNENLPHFALDDDLTTCSVTGWETIGPWWKVDLGTRKTVTALSLTGEQKNHHIGTSIFLSVVAIAYVYTVTPVFC